MQRNSGILSYKPLFWSVVFLCFYWQEVKIKAVGYSLVYNFWFDRKTFVPLGWACNFPSHKNLCLRVACWEKVKSDFLQWSVLDNMLLLQLDGRKSSVRGNLNFWQLQKHCGFNRRWTYCSFVSGVLAACGKAEEVMALWVFLSVNHLNLDCLHSEVLGFWCWDKEYWFFCDAADDFFFCNLLASEW